MSKVESPIRLEKFQEVAKNLTWEDPLQDLQLLYEQVNMLVQAEIDYYYRKRGQKRRISNILRTAMLLFLAIGGLMPVVSNTGILANLDPESWGYVALGLAGIFFTADRTFTGSSGHTRFVTTQLKLEQTLTLFRLKWNRQLMQSKSEESNTKTNSQLFELLLDFTKSFYKILENETSDWSQEVEASLSDIKNTIGS